MWGRYSLAVRRTARVCCRGAMSAASAQLPACLIWQRARRAARARSASPAASGMRGTRMRRPPRLRPSSLLSPLVGSCSGRLHYDSAALSTSDEQGPHVGHRPDVQALCQSGCSNWHSLKLHDLMGRVALSQAALMHRCCRPQRTCCCSRQQPRSRSKARCCRHGGGAWQSKSSGRGATYITSTHSPARGSSIHSRLGSPI